ncbi:MAG: maltotransferase domain-containing protein, partial [Bryobacteraceae bacterium]
MELDRGSDHRAISRVDRKEAGRERVIIEGITPEVDGGRFPAKRTVGDVVRVEADVFADGHDAILAALLYQHESSPDWREAPMQPLVNDRWFGEFRVTELGRYRYTILGWVDHFETWRRDLLKRIEADTDSAIDYQIGADLIEQGATRAKEPDAGWLRNRAAALRGEENRQQHRADGTDAALDRTMKRYPDRSLASRFERELVLVVDPVRARFSSWYEVFPRSTALEPGKHGTFADCEARLPYIAAMGFDVVYL